MCKKVLAILILFLSASLITVSGFLIYEVINDGKSPSNSPERLTAPIVILDGSVALWQVDTNAIKYEVSINGSLEFTDKTSVTLQDGDSLKVRSVGNEKSYLTSEWSNTVVYDKGTPESSPYKLNPPCVSIGESGVASWSALDGAIGYVYRIDGGEEIFTSALGVGLFNQQSITVKAIGDGINTFDSEYSAEKTYIKKESQELNPIKLAPPLVSISDIGIASWYRVEGAVAYVYKINNEGETRTQNTSLQLSVGQTITVKAVGDGVNYTDSDYSLGKKYEKKGEMSPETQPTKLSSPVVSISDLGLASWNSVEGAEGYVYKIDGGDEITAQFNSVLLLDGQTICVKAVGDNTNYLDSDYSVIKTYIAPKPEPIKLGVPIVSISKYGVATWYKVDGAEAYLYRIDGGVEIRTSENSVQLSDGQSISVRSLGDGEIYLDSDFSAPKTYEKTIPIKLATPIISISDTGLVSWYEVASALSYIYIINSGDETVTSSTFVRIADGESIVVKAIGDGIDYSDSDFCESKTYTVKNLPEPVYIGIVATEAKPSVTDGPPDFSATDSSSVFPDSDFSYALEEHFNNMDNYLGTQYPEESDYVLYSAQNRTVYIQIWLENNEKYDILSIKINGNQYFTDSNLESFSIEQDNKNYSCVYAKMTVPGDAHGEIQYTVSDIEYLKDKYISPDKLVGKSSVKIGLPYKENEYSVRNFNLDAVTTNTIGISFDLSDFESDADGWLGFAVCSDNEILYNRAVVEGKNTFLASGLIENTEYELLIYFYSDIHDGSGVSAHVLYYSTAITESAISVTLLESETEYDISQNRCYPVIILESELKTETATFIKVELFDENGICVYTNLNFDGHVRISDGIFNSETFIVKIYYKDTEYPNGKYVEREIYIGSLDECSLYAENYYSTSQGVVYQFKIGNESCVYPYVLGFDFYVYDKGSPQYIADSILTLFDNPNAIDEAYAKYQASLDDLLFVDKYTEEEEYLRLLEISESLKNEWLSLKEAEELYQKNYSDKTDRSFWEAESAKGKYYSTVSYNGIDTDSSMRVLDTYYVILKDFDTYQEYSGMLFRVVARLDKNDKAPEYTVDFGEGELDIIF